MRLISTLLVILLCQIALAENERKNVLMVGDSITLHTRGVVAARVSEFADVFGLPENGRYTGYALSNWDGWLDNLRHIEPNDDVSGGDGNPNGKADTIFNVVIIGHGLWDIARVIDGDYRTPLNVYVANIESLVDKARHVNGTHGEIPTVVISAVTPVPEELSNVSSNADALKYNNELERVVSKRRAAGQHVVYNNLHARAVPILEEHQFPGDVHFTETGYTILGNETARVVRAATLDREPQRLPVVSSLGMLVLCFAFCTLNRVWRMLCI